jgi:hypothetical protein
MYLFMDFNSWLTSVHRREDVTEQGQNACHTFFFMGRAVEELEFRTLHLLGKCPVT